MAELKLGPPKYEKFQIRTVLSVFVLGRLVPCRLNWEAEGWVSG
jgi:hypothetical protein